MTRSLLGRRSRAGSVLIVAAALSLGALPLAGQSAGSRSGLAKPQRVRELIPVYRAAVADPALRALEARVDRADPASIDAWLRAMPLSPLDYLDVKRHLQRSEMPVRKFTQEYHRRWLALHPEEGRRLHGDAAVDAALRGYGFDPLPEEDAPAAAAAEPGIAAATPSIAIDVNRNLAADKANVLPGPEPEEYQGEVQIVADPANGDRLVAAANTWDDMNGACGTDGMQAVFFSDDGGETWGYTCAPDEADFSSAFPEVSCPGTHPRDFGSDPALFWGPDGNVYLAYMLICANNTGTDFRYSIVVARSTDGGETWAPRGVVANSLADGEVFEDKPFNAVDRFATSPFFGRQYTCWDRSNDQLVAFSTDSGATWTEVDLPLPPAGSHDIGCDLAVTDTGVVHVVWNRLTCDAVSCSQVRAYHSRSTDGGESWSAPVEVRSSETLVDFSGGNCATAQEERCLNTFTSLAVDNSSGPCRGTLYAAYTNVASQTSYSPDKANVYLRTSTNGGASWALKAMINSDDVFALNANFHPWLEVDRATGHAVAAWHDTRNSSSHERVEIFLGRSEDCGLGWTNERLSATSDEFNNTSIRWTNLHRDTNVKANPNQFGEYLGLEAGGGRIAVAWTDSRHFFSSFTSDSQRENISFAEVLFEEILIDGFETGDTRIWNAAEGGDD